ncbi:MAG: TonB family protein [Aquificaceae bacterium]
MNENLLALWFGLIISIPAIFSLIYIGEVLTAKQLLIIEPIEIYLIQETKPPDLQSFVEPKPVAIKETAFREKPHKKSTHLSHKPSRESPRQESKTQEDTHSGKSPSQISTQEDASSQPVKSSESGKGEGLQEGAHKSHLSGKDSEAKSDSAQSDSYVAEFRRQNYSIIRELIMRRLEYPLIARAKGWEGRVVVVLCLSPESFCGLEMRQSSGHRVLDDAVVRAVYASSKEFPLPERRLHITLPITFRLTQQD